MTNMLSVILPASNEEAYIGPCLSALFASDPLPAGGAEVIVVANGCRDATADRARACEAQAKAAGWGLTVLELAQGSKPLALNAGDKAARGDLRAYLDADVVVSAGVMAQLVAVLGGEKALYASGTPRIPPAKSALSRAYTRFWQQIPFNQSIAPGYGLFAVNAAGRARWQEFPSLISDDTFVRLQFLPQERRQVTASYDWPMIEGFAALTRVRRRQNQGVAELARLYPGLLDREGKPPRDLPRLLSQALRDPASALAYGLVSLAVRLGPGSTDWARGR